MSEDRAVEGVLPGETATARAAHASLKGERRGLRDLELQRRGFRPLEAAIAALAGLFTPQFAGTESVLLAAGILGATVMPHASTCTRPSRSAGWWAGQTRRRRRSSASSSWTW